MVPIEQKDWTEEDRASKLGQNHPLDSTKRPKLFAFAALRPLAARFIIGHNEIDMAYTERAGELK